MPRVRPSGAPVLNHYSQPLLDSFLSITATGTVLSYGLYTLDPQTIALHHTDKLIYTMPFVLFGLFRYLQDPAHGQQGREPERRRLHRCPHTRVRFCVRRRRRLAPDSMRLKAVTLSIVLAATAYLCAPCYGRVEPT